MKTNAKNSLKFQLMVISNQCISVIYGNLLKFDSNTISIKARLYEWKSIYELMDIKFGNEWKIFSTTDADIT